VGKTAWANFRPPEWVDGEAFLFCGADPAWTPAKEQRLAAAADDKTARSKNDAGGRTPLPAAAAPPSSLVVVCHEHPDCVRRGDIHVPAKYAAMLAED
jgi:hypothetical protein